jgi:probable rRNA maturation factor
VIELYNLQRKIEIDTKGMRDFAAGLVEKVGEAKDKTFTVAIVPDKRMKELNSLFRGKDSTTDVLSFPHEADDFDPDSSNLGDIVISAEQAQKQAGENGLTLDSELKQLILHGVLHLCGYDHETDKGEMNERELELRQKLRI